MPSFTGRQAASGLESAAVRAFFLPIALLVLAGVTAGVQAPEVKVITGATLIDTTGTAIPNTSIVISGPRIVSVGRVPPQTGSGGGGPAGAEVIDARGKFVIPGLADMHNHLDDGGINFQQNRVANLGRLLAAGITTVFNPNVPEGDFTKLKAAAAADASQYPRFFGTGPSITVEGDTLGSQSPKPKTPDEARAVVQKLKALNVDAIKTQRDDFGWASTRMNALMPLEVLQAVVDEAHRPETEGLRARAATAAGEGSAQGRRGWLASRNHRRGCRCGFHRGDETEQRGLHSDAWHVRGRRGRLGVGHASGPVLGPARTAAGRTLPGVHVGTGQGAQVFRSLLNNTAFTKQRLPVLRSNLKKVADAGIPIVMGTDTGFFGVLLGVATPLEMELMVDAGLKPADVIRAATINAARMVGREKEQGTIEAGKVADLLILDANPLENIGAVRRIYRVVKGGVVYDPAKLPR